jgi:predicted dehydrogenase
MEDRTRIGVLGLSHDHVWDNLRALGESPEGLLAAVADPDPELREKVRSSGCEQVFEDPVGLLDAVELDAVWVFSSNRESAELGTLAARRGLHVMVEKPMAADLAGAARAKAITVSTASWTQIGHLTSYEPMLHGSEGTLFVSVRGDELWLANAEHDKGVRLDVPEPPPAERSSAAFLLSHVRSGEPISGL